MLNIQPVVHSISLIWASWLHLLTARRYRHRLSDWGRRWTATLHRHPPPPPPPPAAPRSPSPVLGSAIQIACKCGRVRGPPHKLRTLSFLHSTRLKVQDYSLLCLYMDTLPTIRRNRVELCSTNSVKHRAGLNTVQRQRSQSVIVTVSQAL